MSEQCEECENARKAGKRGSGWFVHDQRQLQAVRAIILKHERACSERGRCVRCWMASGHCICAAMRRTTVHADFHHRAVLYIHPKELRHAAANTGKLIPLSCPGGEIMMADVARSDHALESLVNEVGKHNTVVLFPAQRAIPIPEFMARRAAASSSPSSNESSSTSAQPDASARNALLIIVPDASWGTARYLNKLIPSDITRVVLSGRAEDGPDAVLSGGTKKEGRDGGMMTATAVVQMLREFGAPERVIDDLIHNVRVHAEAYTKQAQKPLHAHNS